MVLQLLLTSLGSVLLAILLILLTYQGFTYLYNICFHPLRKYPGPPLSAASNLPLILQSLRGISISWTVTLHHKYGDVVRIGVNELSFAGANAYKDIYGHKRAAHLILEKDPAFYGSPHERIGIHNADFENHARQRRVFSPAFSDQALKLQEPLFLNYVDRLIEKLRSVTAGDTDQPLDMVQMYNFTTFDIMADLTFGEGLDMLSSSSYHPWVAATLASFKFGVYLHAVRYFPLVEKLLMKYCIPESIKSKRKLHQQFSRSRVDRRLAKQDARADIWGLAMKKDLQNGLTGDEMYTNANLFMIAGTETSATTLSGLTYYLLTHTQALEKLKAELRGAFARESDITIEKLQALPYLNACIDEGLRMYPPAPNGLPRLTPPGKPTAIDGHDVPAGTRVFVTNLAASRNPENWRNPHKFVPERWLPNSPEGWLYASDKKHSFAPFSLGPRGCLGKNMAYHEMRLILAKILYNFDISLCPECADWVDQEIWLMWVKKPLYCQLKPVQRT